VKKKIGFITLLLCAVFSLMAFTSPEALIVGNLWFIVGALSTYSVIKRIQALDATQRAPAYDIMIGVFSGPIGFLIFQVGIWIFPPSKPA